MAVFGAAEEICYKLITLEYLKKFYMLDSNYIAFQEKYYYVLLKKINIATNESILNTAYEESFWGSWRALNRYDN